MTRTYTAWVVCGRTNKEGPFPLWKKVGDFLPHFATRASAMQMLRDRGIRLGGAMRLSVVRFTITTVPAPKRKKTQ